MGSTYSVSVTGMLDPDRTLIVCATAAEAAFVPEHARLLLTGIGKTQAAIAVTRELAVSSLEGLTVINIGSAGALRPGLSGVFEPGVVLNHDINADAIRGLGYDPRERLVVGSSPVVLASGDVFVADPVVRDRLALRADLVDMEGYGVALACQSFGASVRLVKHVSDQADEGAVDWPSLVEASARALGDWLTERLSR